MSEWLRRDVCLGFGKIPEFGRFWANVGLNSSSFQIHSPRKKDRLSSEFFLPSASACGSLNNISLRANAEVKGVN